MPAAPTWVDNGATEVNGLDLLGLRAPAMRIGNTLLDGITTVTPTIRYLGFVTWLTWLYWKRAGADKLKSYLEFARRIEAAICLGNLAFDSTTTGLVGTDGAGDALTDPDGVPLNLKVRALATNLYSTPAQQLGLLAVRGDSEVPHLTKSRGLAIAAAVDAAFRQTPLGSQLSDGEVPERIPIDELRLFGEVAWVHSIPPKEQSLLINALLPEAPCTPIERSRFATYTAFLARASEGQARQRVRALLVSAVDPDRRIPRILDDVIDGWVCYQVRDVLAVAHEYALAALVGQLPREGAPWVESVDVVRSALLDATAQEAVLLDLDLITRNERWDELTFADLESRLVGRTCEREVVERGVRRWVGGGLAEHDLVRIIRSHPIGAPVALPVAWLLAARRVGQGVEQGHTSMAALSWQGRARLGMEQIVLPRLDRFRRTRDSSSLPDVVAELLSWTVEQHLRTAWSRQAVNVRKDVALLHSDGNRWAYRKKFRAGQTNSRLGQLDGWLNQLGLRNDEGLTDDGQRVLDRALQVVAQGAKT